MPAVRGFYGFKRKTLWRRYRFSLPFFFFFILFIVHAARGRIGKYNKTWSVSLLLLLARIAWIENAMFARWCKPAEKRCLGLKIFHEATRTYTHVISWSKFYLFVFSSFFFFSFSKFHIKIRLQGYGRNGRKLAQCYDSLIKRLWITQIVNETEFDEHSANVIN